MPDDTEITQSNRDALSDLHSEVHESLRLLRKLDALLTQFEPVIAQFTSPVAAGSALRRARKAGR
jgi:hypothetical protein